MKHLVRKSIVILFLFLMRCIGSLPNKSCKIFGLQYVAKRSFEKGKYDKARKQAQELLNLAPEFRDGFSDGNAIHHANAILGLVSVKEDNIEKAKEHLLLSAKTQGSPQLNSFGPNMSLAKELLLQDEKESVLEYFKLCSRFWQNPKLSIWALEVKDGKMPKFGSNLNY